MEQIWTWFKDNVTALLVVLGSLGVVYRNEQTTQQLKKTIFNKDGSLKVMRASDCERQCELCKNTNAADHQLIRSEIRGMRDDFRSFLSIMLGGNGGYKRRSTDLWFENRDEGGLDHSGRSVEASRSAKRSDDNGGT